MKSYKCNNVKQSDLIGLLATTQWVLTFIFVGPFCGLFLIYLCFTKWFWISILYMIYYWMDHEAPAKGGKQSNSLRNWVIWQWMAAYFPVKLIKTCELDIDSNYLIGYHPHGVLNVGGFLNFAVNGSHVDQIFPNFKTYLTVLKGHFDFPIYRDYVMKSGLVSVAKESIRYLLEGVRRRGQLVVIVMGGSNEALDAHSGFNNIHLKEKIGIFTIALQTGTPLVPCYSFGENNCYNQVSNFPGTKVRKIQNMMTHLFGFSPPLFYGRGLAPLPRPINTVVGTPIPVEKIEHPTKDDIEQLRNVYINALRQLFDEYKPIYAADELDIEIV